ncbi:TetR/AcrR family transcriptional regulator [Lentzea tibetensis]|uniref:TetR/AcrR family transcriptional regulator n=1 Tax=Lentzea tibetensis TaxID=2591470 RepID=A0A563EWW7_9PSEU|nr:TetR/AcrR family transcriptional regulator [Lentzea tibetensis]TWP52206.1 TetR/AcrR family transcriptional regulator [Lentzea tibetensis]
MSAAPNRDRRAERREATRREIVDAAWEIARRDGISAVTLREVAAIVGMRSPSLYSHFESKNAIYDAMFGDAWALYLDRVTEHLRTLPDAPREALLSMLRHFFDFATADLARYQLMNQRSIPGFEPSPASYAPSVEVMAQLHRTMRSLGITDEADIDLYTALGGGLVDMQLANDPGGDRWRRHLPRVVDMFADDVNLPGPRLRSSR